MRDSFIVKRYMYEAIKGLSPEHRLKLYDSLFEYALNDVPIPDELPMSALHIIKDQIDSNIKSYENFNSRVSKEYRKWKNAVLKRDKSTCRACGCKNDIEVHHIVPYAKDPDIRFDPDNGIVLCKECHRKVHQKHE